MVRRPGNTYSNFVYFFHSLLVLISVYRDLERGETSDPFWVSDLLFGVMLLILSMLSVLWHASNAPKSQYIDLWYSLFLFRSHTHSLTNIHSWRSTC